MHFLEVAKWHKNRREEKRNEGLYLLIFFFCIFLMNFEKVAEYFSSSEISKVLKGMISMSRSEIKKIRTRSLNKTKKCERKS